MQRPQPVLTSNTEFVFFVHKNLKLTCFFHLQILGLLLKCYSEETIDSTSEKDKRAQKIANLWMEMQQYGLPPPELAANLHDANISSSSDPRIENECSLM
jgi:hypothetical protein